MGELERIYGEKILGNFSVFWGGEKKGIQAGNDAASVLLGKGIRSGIKAGFNCGTFIGGEIGLIEWGKRADPLPPPKKHR